MAPFDIEVIVRDSNRRVIGTGSWSISDPWDELPALMRRIDRFIDASVMEVGGWPE